MPTYQIGRVGRVYAAVEASYAPSTPTAMVAGDAVRHLDLSLNVNPRNRVNSPERHTHPSQLYRFTRRKTADFKVGGIFYPSGVLGTDPDHSPLLEHAMGTKAYTAGSTTFSGTPTTTTGTVGSATGMTAGTPILITIAAGASAGKYVRWLTSGTSGTALVWAPALPAAPAAADTCKRAISYSLATALTSSLSLLHVLSNIRYQGVGMVANTLKLTFDANNEVMWEVTGPMKDRLRDASATADPSTFTTVGTTPPSGLTGGFVADTSENMLKAEIEINNAMELDNFNFGTSVAAGYFRKGKRSVTCTINRNVDDDVTMLDASEATTDKAVVVQCGDTEGSIIAVYMPKVEFDVPDDSAPEELIEHAFKGTAKGATGNDEIYLAVA